MAGAGGDLRSDRRVGADVATFLQQRKKRHDLLRTLEP
jgi:hypothetical protein